MIEKIKIKKDDLGEAINILKIKDLVIEANEKAIIARTKMLDDKSIDKATKIKLRKNIEELNKSVEFLKDNEVRYKFNDLFVKGRNGLGQAQFKPGFIKEWKIHMDTAEIPPTIVKAIDRLKIKRPYNHIKFNDITNEESDVGTALIQFTSIRINALRQPQEATFTISCSFTEGAGVSIKELENSLDDMDV